MTWVNQFELIVGMKKDPVFGAVIMVGMGGTAAEIFRDRALALPPLNEYLGHELIGSTKAARLLQRFRNLPEADTNMLTDDDRRWIPERKIDA